MTEFESPWPDRERTQVLLMGAGALFLLPGALGLVGLVEFGGTVVVGSTTVASALLLYGLLGWGGHWVDGDDPGSEESSS